MTTPTLHVLIVAHPDDESMFFVPTLRALKSAKEEVWILCLTTGDYDGLGKIREKEIMAAGKLLGVEKVFVNNRLKDHPTERWEASNVAMEIKDTLTRELSNTTSKWKLIKLLTFDNHGISGHVNHIDTFYGVQTILKDKVLKLTDNGANKVETQIEGWQLVSERNIFRKYIPIHCWILLVLSFFVNVPTSIGQDRTKIYRLNEPSLNWAAMNVHKSQFVWYRRLFVVFSCYTYVNKLELVEVPA